jgi:hypothetical protein
MIKNLNKMTLTLCVFSVMLSFLLPSFRYEHSDSLSRLNYGLPFGVITLYTKSNSLYLVDSITKSNEGVAINPLSFFVNISILYMLANVLIKKAKRKARPAQ